MSLDISALPVIEDGSITSAKLADGAVTAPKLAESAVVLTDSKVAGLLPGTKLADEAVTASKLAAAAVTAPKVAESAIVLTSSVVAGQLPTSKLADMAVTSDKIADQAVGVSKTTQQVRQVPLQRNTNEVSVLGTTETEVKTFTFSKKNASPWISLAINAGLKVSAAGTATLKVYVNAETSPRATLTATSTSYDTQETGNIDISDLVNGDHVLRFKLASDNALVTAYNKLLEVFAEKDVA